MHGQAPAQQGPGAVLMKVLLLPLALLGLGGGGDASNAVERAAVFNALESMPGADALMAPRWNIKEENYIIFKRIEATVKGKGVRYNVTSQ